MKRFLLDSDTCIFYLRKRYDIAGKISSAGVWNCSISQVTVAELRYGAECSDFSRQSHDEIDEFCEFVSVAPVNDAIIHVFASEKARLRKLGQLIPDFDLLIGSTAVYYNLTLITNNTRHFSRLRGLKLENWTTEKE